MKSRIKIILMILLIQGASACVRVDTGTNMPTIGDQIIDLVKAKNMGVITEEEFKQLRGMALASF
ncbi:MAG: hypothetical protein JKY88_02005 [Pseudomonadales bacterium]|nr:hypothetical protein [Pseudomonadales bacterium]